MNGLLARLLLSLMIASLCGCARRDRIAPADITTFGEAANEETVRPAPGSRLIGTSHEGRKIHAEAIVGSRSDAGGAGSTGPVLIIACIHGDEQEGLGAVDLIRDRAADGSRSVLLIENMNPDGVASHTRENASRVDLNRNWPTRNFRPSRAHGPSALSEPESRAVHDLLNQARPSLVIVLHSTPSGPFVNFDGPAGEAAARFADACERVDPRWRVVADMGYPTPGSLGTLVGDEWAIPILTIEFRKGQDAASVRAALDAGLRAVLN